MKKLLLLTILAVQINAGFGQTTIQGIINSDVILIKDNSPYLVTGDLVVFPKWKLTVEPGVELRFENNVKLQIRGALMALGTENDSISFISNTGTDNGVWQGIEIMNTLGGNASFDYCNFSHSSVAILEECCWGGNLEIKNSHFTFNAVALSGYSGTQATVDNCYFANNGTCISHADKIINNCIFENNEYGLNMTERVSVSNSTFTNHSKIALYGGRGQLTDCIITDNNIGVKAFFEGFTIENCDISNNQVGIELNDYYNGSRRYVSPVNNSTICNNIQFNVKNNSMCDVDLYTNCWCTSDSTTVENLIYDAWDNYNVGFVNYVLFADNCIEPILKTFKAENRVQYFTNGINSLTNDKIIIYQNPASSTLFIKNAENLINIKIYDHIGKLLMNRFDDFDNNLIELNISGFASGLYVVSLTNQNNETVSKKVIIAK